MKQHYKILLVFLLILSARASADVTFITAQDHFTVKKSGSHYTVEGKPVLNHLLDTLTPYLEGQATDDCPKDLTGRAPVVAKIGNETREFFIKRSLVRVDGAKCFFATGDGLYFLPMHRTWLIGPFREHTNINSPVKVSAGSDVLVNIYRKDNEWLDTNPKTELDWDFWQKFERSLADYNVQYRVALDAAKGKPVVTLQSGTSTYLLYKLGPKLWAIQKPGHKWLDASGDWVFWFDLDRNVWQERHVAIIRKVESGGMTTAMKLDAMKGLEDGWSRALEEFYQRRMLDQNEDPQIRMKAVARLKSKPSWRNMRAMMALLDSNPNDEMLKEATQAMHTRNPKGTIYTPNESDRLKTITEWQTWWQANKNRKD